MPGKDGIGTDPNLYVDQGIPECPVTLHFEEGVNELTMSGDQLRKMTGAKSLNFTKASIIATSNHSQGAQSIVIKNNGKPIETNRRHFMVSGSGDASVVAGAHYVAGPGNHNKLTNPFEIHLRTGPPMTDAEHHQSVMKQLKWASLEGHDKDSIFKQSNIVEAEMNGVKRYAVSVDPQDGPFPALLAGKSEAKLKEMLPRSSIVPTEINGKSYRIIQEDDLNAGLEAFASITSKEEIGTKGLTWKRSGDTDGDLIVQAVLHREPHPNCPPHDHLPGQLKGLKLSDVADSVGSISDATAPQELQQTAAAAAIFGDAVVVKDAAAKKNFTGSATIVTGFSEEDPAEEPLDGGDQ